jgi:hypothetical protein
MVGIVGYRDSEGGAEAHAVLCSLDPDPVVTIFCHAAHLLSLNAIVETDNLAPIIPTIETTVPQTCSRDGHSCHTTPNPANRPVEGFRSGRKVYPSAAERNRPRPS